MPSKSRIAAVLTAATASAQLVLMEKEQRVELDPGGVVDAVDDRVGEHKDRDAKDHPRDHPSRIGPPSRRPCRRRRCR